MVDEGICNTRLRLGIGALDDDHHNQKQKKISSKRVMSLDLSFPNFHDIKDEHEEEREEEEEEEERQSITSNNNNNNNGNGDHHDDKKVNNGGGRSCARKKLRLTQEQSTVLEDSFKLHTTLNTAQKQALSEKLNLKPRQVEVWFQNRRARTKLKQTEVDCEFLKKYCENLRDENRKLKKEVQELRSSSSSPSLLLFQENISKLQNSSTLLCPSCDQKMVNRSTSTTTSSDAADDVVLAVHKPNPLLPNPSGFNFFSNH